MSVYALNGSIAYRADRLRFIIVALFVFPFTVLIAWLADNGVLLGDTDIRGSWLTVALCALYIWFDYVLVAKIVRPPELSISPKGIRWSNYAMLQWPTNYEWQELEGPELTSDAHGGALLQFFVKATGRKLKLPPSHFGANYDEMAAIISAARVGELISPEQWRAEHPPSQVGGLAESKRLIMWLAIAAIALFFFQDVLFWVIERGGIFSVISILYSVKDHSAILNLDKSGLRFPIIVIVCAAVCIIAYLFRIRVDGSNNKVHWILIFAIIGGGYVIDGLFGESMITDYLISQNYSRCTPGDYEQGHGKSSVYFANYVLVGTKCRPTSHEPGD